MDSAPPSGDASSTPAEFSARLRTRLDGMSGRALAKRAGYPPSTVAELKKGERLPSAEQLQDLLGAAGATDDEVADWLAELASLRGHRTAPPVPVPAETSPGPGRAWTRRAAVSAAALTALVGTFAAGWALGSAGTDTVPVGSVTTVTVSAPAGFAPTVLPGGVPARVANTEGLGVSTYRGPHRKSGQVAPLSEGAQIVVVCQVPDGEALTDYVGGRQVTSPVWDQLASGAFVPDIYTDLPKSAAGQAPPNLRRC